MKLLILLFLIFPMNLFAGYMSLVDAMDCNKSGRTFYLKLNLCQSNHSDCKEIPNDFNCATYADQDTSVDDLTNPIFSKNEIEVCTGQVDCEAKNFSKTCADIDERVLMAQDFSEIYCSKFLNYDQKIIRMIREDATKKAAWDIVEAGKTAALADLKTNRGAAKSLIAKMEAGTPLTPLELREVLMPLLKEMRD